MSCCKSENLLIYNVISCLEYYDHVLFQTFPGASRTGIHNEGLLQRVDAHSHVCRNWGKALTSWWKSAYILKQSFLDHTHHRIPGINPNLNIEQFPPTQKSLFNFCNFGHFVESYQRSGYCSFYQILHNLQMVFVLPILAMATTLRGFWWKNLSKILFLMHTINMTKATVDAHHWHRHQGADLLGLDLHVREGDRLYLLHLRHWRLLVGFISI